MKRRPLFRSCLTSLLLAGLIFISFLWYIGLIPIFNGPARAGVRNALNLWKLPVSLRVNSSGYEAWTDYIFEADLSINAKDFDQLLSGRRYEFRAPVPGTKTAAIRIDHHDEFLVAEIWETHYPPASSPPLMVTKAPTFRSG